VIYDFKRPIGFNGVNLAATKSDLKDRGFTVQLERIEEDKRRDRHHRRSLVILRKIVLKLIVMLVTILKQDRLLLVTILATDRLQKTLKITLKMAKVTMVTMVTIFLEPFKRSNLLALRPTKIQHIGIG
jgi:hypothetical protein